MIHPLNSSSQTNGGQSDRASSGQGAGGARVHPKGGLFLAVTGPRLRSNLIANPAPRLPTARQGRILNLLGYMLSFYCVFKVCNSLINVIFMRARNNDPVTRVMQIAVNGLGIDLNVQLWSQHVSFFLVRLGLWHVSCGAPQGPGVPALIRIFAL